MRTEKAPAFSRWLDGAVNRVREVRRVDPVPPKVMRLQDALAEEAITARDGTS